MVMLASKTNCTDRTVGELKIKLLHAELICMSNANTRQIFITK